VLARAGVEARHHARVRDAAGHAGEHLAGGRKVGRGLCAGGAEDGYGGEHAGGCERTETPTNAPPASGPRADLTAPTPNTDWLVRALSLGAILSDDPLATAWTRFSQP